MSAFIALQVPFCCNCFSVGASTHEYADIHHKIVAYIHSTNVITTNLGHLCCDQGLGYLFSLSAVIACLWQHVDGVCFHSLFLGDMVQGQTGLGNDRCTRSFHSCFLIWLCRRCVKQFHLAVVAVAVAMTVLQYCLPAPSCLLGHIWLFSHPLPLPPLSAPHMLRE